MKTGELLAKWMGKVARAAQPGMEQLTLATPGKVEQVFDCGAEIVLLADAQFVLIKEVLLAMLGCSQQIRNAENRPANSCYSRAMSMLAAFLDVLASSMKLFMTCSAKDCGDAGASVGFLPWTSEQVVTYGTVFGVGSVMMDSVSVASNVVYHCEGTDQVLMANASSVCADGPNNSALCKLEKVLKPAKELLDGNLENALRAAGIVAATVQHGLSSYDSNVMESSKLDWASLKKGESETKLEEFVRSSRDTRRKEIMRHLHAMGAQERRSQADIERVLVSTLPEEEMADIVGELKNILEDQGRLSKHKALAANVFGRSLSIFRSMNMMDENSAGHCADAWLGLAQMPFKLMNWAYDMKSCLNKENTRRNRRATFQTD